MQAAPLILVSYLAVANLFAFAIFGWDKLAAVHGHWRVPESTLLGLAAAGGSVGAFAAQRLFRHKVSKSAFQVRFAAILLVQVAVLIGLAVWRPGA